MQHKVFRSFFCLTLVLALTLTQSSVAFASGFTVDSTLDAIDANPGDGICASTTGECTLRAAIQEANALPGDDTISLPAGTYTLTIAGTDEDAAINGDLDITENLDIDGSSATSTIIDGNSSLTGERVMNIHGVSVNITGMTIKNGYSASGYGGGIFNDFGTTTLNESTINGNTVELYGGGIGNFFGTVILNDSTVSNNSSSQQHGGGIYSVYGILILNNSTVSGNTAGRSCGGICNGGNTGTVTLNNSTITNNIADSDNNGDGGFGGIGNDSGIVNFRNTIIANNVDNGMNTPDCGNSGLTSQGYNLIGNTTGCTIGGDTTGNLTGVDPTLGPLQDNGGPTFTHALLSGSPAIDAGNPAGCTDQNGDPLTTDQRGVARVGTCDIGAYEVPTAGLLVIGGDHQRTETTFAFPQPLQVTVFDNQGSPASGVTVTFTAPVSGPSGTFSDTSTNITLVDTDANGVAITSIFTANDQAGAYTVSASALGLGSVNFSLEQVSRPANDNFTNAEIINSLPFSVSVDITEASHESGEPGVCALLDKSVWYSFTPAEAMLVTTYIQENIGFSIINVYRGNGGGMDSLSFLTCQGNNSPYTFLAGTGQTYYLQVGTIPGFDGTIQVHLDQVPAPANDQFADAINIGAVPVLTNFDIGGATLEDSEPTPSCLSGSPFFESVWYVFSPSENASLSATLSYASFSPVMAVYSGASFNDLTALGCGGSGNTITFQAVSGQTYYFQIGSFYPELGSGSFLLEMTRPPVASFYYYPGDPSKYETIQFQDNSYDPGNLGIQTYAWNFGDGSVASGYYSTHKYAADGDYQVTHTVTTVDGRIASAIQTVQVRTHDVAITKIAVPASANVGQTKTITVTLRNIAYPETVQIDLYKSTPNGFEYVATVTKSVAALSGNRTTSVNFSYKFTSDDARLGKVTFKAVVTIIGARDSYPADNEKISTITKVAR